jgi:uncharacterized protein with FMN-binding domain
MSTTPWRGTIIFVGGIAAIAATAATRFAGAEAATPALGSAGSSATQGTGSTAAGTTTNTGSSSSSPAATPSSKAASTSGTVTVVGSTVQTPYGPLQLSVTFNGSKISAVQALQYPNWHGESVRINQYAIPQLNQEAVAAGSANINGVSGATFTSEAYVQSLQAAIDQHG